MLPNGIAEVSDRWNGDVVVETASNRVQESTAAKEGFMSTLLQFNSEISDSPQKEDWLSTPPL